MRPRADSYATTRAGADSPRPPSNDATATIHVAPITVDATAAVQASTNDAVNSARTSVSQNNDAGQTNAGLECGRVNVKNLQLHVVFYATAATRLLRIIFFADKY